MVHPWVFLFFTIVHHNDTKECISLPPWGSFDRWAIILLGNNNTVFVLKWFWHQTCHTTLKGKGRLYKPSRQFWDYGRWKSESLWNFSIVGCQFTVNCLLGSIFFLRYGSKVNGEIYQSCQRHSYVDILDVSSLKIVCNQKN